MLDIRRNEKINNDSTLLKILGAICQSTECLMRIEENNHDFSSVV